MERKKRKGKGKEKRKQRERRRIKDEKTKQIIKSLLYRILLVFLNFFHSCILWCLGLILILLQKYPSFHVCASGSSTASVRQRTSDHAKASVYEPCFQTLEEWSSRAFDPKWNLSKTSP